MENQLRQAYDIDNRRAGTYTERAGQPISATDNEAAKNFLASFTKTRNTETLHLNQCVSSVNRMM